MEKLLEVKGLKTQFKTGMGTVKAVDGVSFDVYKGETFGIVGESGCGKSQTCRSVLKLIKKPGKITEGQILYQGEDLIPMKNRKMQQIRGKQISAIFQDPMTSLNPIMKIRDQIFEVFKGSGMTKEQMEERAIKLLSMVGIPAPKERMNDYPHQFSGGMRQRVMIAIALGANPQLLIADEPTTALDVTIQNQIMVLINQLKEELGMSVILVTHDMGVIAQMCDRVAVMYAGKIVEMTDTVSLFAKPRHPYTYGLMKSLPDGQKSGEKLSTIEGSIPNMADLPPGCSFAPRCPYAGEACKKAMPELTEVEPGHLARCCRPDKTAAFEGIIPVPEGEKAEEADR